MAPVRSTRQQIMAAARSDPDATYRQIAAMVGCHESTVARHLKGRQRRHRPRGGPGPAEASLRAGGRRGGAPTGRKRPGTEPPTAQQLVLMRALSDDWRVRRLAASSDDAPPSVLARLAVDRSAAVRAQAADNSRCPAEAINRIVSNPSEDPALRSRAAAHPACSTTALQTLVGSGNKHLESRAAGHRNATPEQLARLLGSADSVTRWAAVHNPNMTPELLAAAAEGADLTTALAVARHPNTSTATLARIEADLGPRFAAGYRDPNDRDQQTLAAVLDHPNISTATLDRIAACGDPWLRAAAVRSPAQTPESLAAVLSDASRSAVWGQVAANPRCTPELLNRVAHQVHPLHGPRDGREREAALAHVATHPNCPLPLMAGAVQAAGAEGRRRMAADGSHSGLLTRLAGDDNEKVRLAVAANSDTRPDNLRTLAGDPSTAVADAALKNPSTPADALESADMSRPAAAKAAAANPSAAAGLLDSLAGHPDAAVRREVALHPSTPAQARGRLAADHEYDVRIMAVKWPNLPASAVRIAAMDDNPAVRGWIARRSDCPPELLAQLGRDPSDEVRSRVLDNLHTPTPLLRRLTQPTAP